ESSRSWTGGQVAITKRTVNATANAPNTVRIAPCFSSGIAAVCASNNCAEQATIASKRKPVVAAAGVASRDSTRVETPAPVPATSAVGISHSQPLAREKRIHQKTVAYSAVSSVKTFLRVPAALPLEAHPTTAPPAKPPTLA